ncbi:MAG: hypothetical protein BGO06_26215 [Shinella sp. 65-6]|nr:MAG: hypothetical protein BGO06_26215 [Shinella sp. 65-6]
MTTNAHREGFGDDRQSLQTMARVFDQPPGETWLHLDQFVSDLYLDTRGADDAPGLDDLRETFRDLAAYVGFLSAWRAHLAYREAEMHRQRAERRKQEEEFARSLNRLIARRIDVATDLPPAERQVLADALDLQSSLAQALEVPCYARPRRFPRTLHLAKTFVREVRSVWSFVLQRDMSCSTDRQMIRFAVAVWRDVGFYEPAEDLFGWLLRHFREVKTL